MEDEDFLLANDHQYCSSSFEISSFDCDAEGLKYIGGYVASKFLARYPFLGKKSSECYSIRKTAPWIAALSRGGLVIPTERFMAQLYEMEKIFNAFHGDSISSHQHIIRTFFRMCQSKIQDVPPDVLMKYARTRTFIRVRFLNSKLRASQVKNYYHQIHISYEIHPHIFLCSACTIWLLLRKCSSIKICILPNARLLH